MGSPGTFVLCTASSRCTRVAGPSGNETTDCAGLARVLAFHAMCSFNVNIYIACADESTIFILCSLGGGTQSLQLGRGGWNTVYLCR